MQKNKNKLMYIQWGAKVMTHGSRKVI